MTKRYNFDTLQVHAGQESDKTTGSRAVPIYQTTSYVFDNFEHAENLFALQESGNIYTRIMNPTTDILEKRVATLESGAAALAVSSGSSAITYAILTICRAGDEIVAANTLYGGTYNLFQNTLPGLGIKTTFVHPENLENFENAINSNTKAIYIESIGNPTGNIVDISEVAKIAHANNIPLIIDNTFATPYLLRPIEHGADIVVHSLTKFLGGHGNSIGGIIIDSGKFDWAKSGKFPLLTEPEPGYHGLVFTEAAANLAFITRARVTLLRDTGAAISPFNSFLFLQGLETLSLRLERHASNAIKIANHLNDHPCVEEVNYASLPNNKYNELSKKYFPKGSGAILTFKIKGDKEEAKKFINALHLFSLVANVGDAKSLVIHPASTTHQQLSKEDLIKSGITQNLIRLSIGIEDVNDLISDLENGFAGV